MPKRIKHLLIAAAALCIVAAAGLTLAFMFKKAEKTNRINSEQDEYIHGNPASDST